MSTVETVGRTDVDQFFSKSGYYAGVTRWKNYPLIAFPESGSVVRVTLLRSQSELRSTDLPDNTPCMQQWGGEWRSDFFRFTLGEARAALNGRAA